MRPIISNKILTAKSIMAVDMFAIAIRMITMQTDPIIGINALFTSFIFSCFRVNILAKKVISANLAMSDVWNVWLITGMVTHLLASFTDSVNNRVYKRSGMVMIIKIFEIPA